MSSSHYLASLFDPKIFVIFGASNREGALGKLVVNNIVSMGYAGDWLPINPKYNEVQNKRCYHRLHDIDDNINIDLAIVAVPLLNVLDILSDCGRRGIGFVILISDNERSEGNNQSAIFKKIIKKCRQYNIRLLGPYSVGLIRPHLSLNASCLSPIIKRGNLALVSQSAALCSAMIDWAQSQEIGFSAVITTGTALDVDFGEVLDFLVTDTKTHSILLYIEGIKNSRAFMTGLRAVARAKPVVVVKSGRHKADDHAFMVSHTGALVGRDQVFDAALQRAGVVRSENLGDLFSIASILARGVRVKKSPLAILSNGVGPSMMACDRASDFNVPLAVLSDKTKETLCEYVKNVANPVNLPATATAQEYQMALRAVLRDASVGGVLVLLTPQPYTNPLETAKSVIGEVKSHWKPVLTCWMGDAVVYEARKLLHEAGIPSFRLPENAVKAFASILEYHHNQKLLIQTPGPLADINRPNIEHANSIIASALEEPRNILTEVESKQLLTAFHIPVVNTGIAHNSEQTLELARQIGFPVVLKVYSKKITHKSDIGGVKLGIKNVGELLLAYDDIIQVAELHAPGSVEGVVVEPMVNHEASREFLVGIVRDPVFGPVISLGSGGVTAEIIADNSVALPPLNHLLVEELISRTRVDKLLGEMRGIPKAKRSAVINVLLRVSEIACEIPAIRELDINPLVVDDRQALVVDSRIVVDEYMPEQHYGHTAIHPYPSHLIFRDKMVDGTAFTIRPIRPEDAEIERTFVDGLSDQAKFHRFLHAFKEITPEMLAQFTLIDYDREMAFIAVVNEGLNEEEIAVCRYVTNYDLTSCEFAIVVGDKWQRCGLAQKLMRVLMGYAVERGLQRMEGDVLADNMAMLKLVKGLGFEVRRCMDDGSIVKVVLDLRRCQS